jgi:hypothetical protein
MFNNRKLVVYTQNRNDMNGLSEFRIMNQPSSEEMENVWQQTFQFANAVINKDSTLLATLLSEEFTYFNNKNKWETLEYFKLQFTKDIPVELFSDDVGIRFCRGCQPGNPALVFHKGYFPILEEDMNSPKAVALAFKDGKISDLSLCFRFCESDQLKKIAAQN